MSLDGQDHRRALWDCELPLSSDPFLRRPKDPLPPPRPLQRSPSTAGFREDGALGAGRSGTCLHPDCVTLGESLALSELQFLSL